MGWIRKDTGETHEHTHGFGAGAMWWATWYPKNFTWENETEPHLMVRCPNSATDPTDCRDWDVDSQCANCTLPDDNTHRCWVRHGEVPNITVNKDGHSCAAGKGSILLPGWHGMLTDGKLTQC